jgi:hypothetical protein
MRTRHSAFVAATNRVFLEQAAFAHIIGAWVGEVEDSIEKAFQHIFSIRGVELGWMRLALGVWRQRAAPLLEKSSGFLYIVYNAKPNSVHPTHLGAK